MARELISFDWAMNSILRQKANFGILEGFLSELLKFDIKIEEVLESEANQETEYDKFNRVDLLAKDKNEKLILIEVQHSSETDYFHRMLYGTSKLISEYLQKGRGYSEIKKVYSVNIVYFSLGQGEDYIYYGKMDFIGVHKKDTLLPSQNQKKVFEIENVSEIYPEYYILKVNGFDDIAKNSLDEWIYFLKNSEIEENFKAKGISEAKERLDVLKLDEKGRAIYRRKQENLMYRESLLETAKFEGRKEGRKEGRQEGLKEGRKEGKIEVAKTLLSMRLSIEEIERATGLSQEEIENLKNGYLQTPQSNKSAIK
jgi:predicted transposase/invertase (TIGR01784 family)